MQWADWNPAGDDLAILRTVDGKARIEMPVGKVLYESVGWITTPRVSPDGKSIAFIEHPVAGNDAGFVALLDGGKKRVLTPYYESAQGLAWRPDGKEVWFTGAEHGNSNVLMAVGVSGGAPRLIVATPGILRLCDIARDGRVLVMEATMRQRIVFRGPGDAADHDLSWLDWSRLVDISPDGKAILFDETGEGAGAKAGVYVRATDGSPAVRLGDGVACAFSPDRRSVLAIWPLSGASQIWVYPTGTGQTRQITNDPADRIVTATFTPDGRSVVYRAIESGSSRLFVQGLDGRGKKVISPQGVGGIALQCSPDGKWVYAFGSARMGVLYSLNGGTEVKIPEIRNDDAVIRWTDDSKGLLFFTRNEYPARVRRLDVATHRVTPVREITVAESDLGAAGIRMTPDLKAYAYSMYTTAGDLFQLQGVH